ncbi:MAG: serine/threonine-protein kinase [Acidobacteriota bacterium]
MTWLSDEAVARLQDAAGKPDFAGTRYRLVAEVGRGGMGVVFEAEDLELERRVAVKVLAPELSTFEAAARLRREARIVARLEHPGIVPVHDVGELRDGRIFYAMKLVRGECLDAWAARNASRTDRLRVFLRICEAVAFAHAHGVLHRDLKPENVMVGEFGAVLVMDWGVAISDGESHDAGTIVGTPGFMPPEQARGERGAGAADVWGLGAILRFLLEGGEAVPRPLAAIRDLALREAPGERYPGASELAADVTSFLDGKPVAAHPENLFERIGRTLSRHRVLATLIAAYLAMRVFVFLWARR